VASRARTASSGTPVKAVRPQAVGYVAVPVGVEDGQVFVAMWRERFLAHVESVGLELGPVFTDVHGRTESGLYALVGYLRRHGAVAVVVPDQTHLTHGGCLAGADQRAAERFLWAPVVYAAGGPPSDTARA